MLAFAGQRSRRSSRLNGQRLVTDPCRLIARTKPTAAQTELYELAIWLLPKHSGHPDDRSQEWSNGRTCPIVPPQHHHRKQPPAGKRRLAGSRAGLRSQSARRSPRHHRPRCPSTALSTPAWSDPVGVERPSGSSCACRSMSPSCVASSAYRRRTDRGRRPTPSARRSSRTDG